MMTPMTETKKADAIANLKLSRMLLLSDMTPINIGIMLASNNPLANTMEKMVPRIAKSAEDRAIPTMVGKIGPSANPTTATNGIARPLLSVIEIKPSVMKEIRARPQMTIPLTFAFILVAAITLAMIKHT